MSWGGCIRRVRWLGMVGDRQVTHDDHGRDADADMNMVTDVHGIGQGQGYRHHDGPGCGQSPGHINAAVWQRKS